MVARLVSRQFFRKARKVDARLPGKGNSNSHGARPVHLIITMVKWIRTSWLTIKDSLSFVMSSNIGCPGQPTVVRNRCRANMAHIRQSRPDSSLGFQVKVLKPFLNGSLFARERMRKRVDVIRKEAWPFYRTISGVRLCWELEEPNGPIGLGRDMIALMSWPASSKLPK